MKMEKENVCVKKEMIASMRYKVVGSIIARIITTNGGELTRQLQ